MLILRLTNTLTTDQYSKYIHAIYFKNENVPYEHSMRSFVNSLFQLSKNLILFVFYAYFTLLRLLDSRRG